MLSNPLREWSISRDPAGQFSVGIDVLPYFLLIDIGLVHDDEAGTLPGWDLLAASGISCKLYAVIAHFSRLLGDRHIHEPALDIGIDPGNGVEHHDLDGARFASLFHALCGALAGKSVHPENATQIRLTGENRGDMSCSSVCVVFIVLGLKHLDVRMVLHLLQKTLHACIGTGDARLVVFAIDRALVADGFRQRTRRNAAAFGIVRSYE